MSPSILRKISTTPWQYSMPGAEKRPFIPEKASCKGYRLFHKLMMAKSIKYHVESGQSASVQKVLDMVSSANLYEAAKMCGWKLGIPCLVDYSIKALHERMGFLHRPCKKTCLI
jgi:hypothetical protein